MQHVGVNMCKLRVRQPSRLSHTYLPLADEFAIRGSFATNKPEVGGGYFFCGFLGIWPRNVEYFAKQHGGFEHPWGCRMLLGGFTSSNPGMMMMMMMVPHGFLNTVFTVTIPVMSCQSLSIIIWLVVSNLFCFPQYMGQSFPLTNLYFSRWWKPPTSCVWVTSITYHRYRKSVSYHRSMAMMSMATQSWSSMIIAGHWNWQWYTLW